MTASKAFKALQRRALLVLHEAGLRIGLIVLPRHYYVPVADLRELRRTRKLWAKRSTLTGIAVNLEEQANNLRQLVLPWRDEYRDGRSYAEAVARNAGPGYGPIEAMALHGMVRALKPRRVVEVGSGASTAVILEADRLNRADGGIGATITCIEPYPRPWLRSAPVELIEAPVQQVPDRLFPALEASDLLFLDSSHTVRTGGDVNLMVLEVLPRLATGVIVHMHDIFLPYDFQRDADRTMFQWQETALVHAWLIGNREVEILFAMSMLHYDRPAVLAEVFPGYRRQPDQDGLATDGAEAGHFPSSLWLRIGGQFQTETLPEIPEGTTAGRSPSPAPPDPDAPIERLLRGPRAIASDHWIPRARTEARRRRRRSRTNPSVVGIRTNPSAAASH